jgi:hypothetical protein
MRRVNVSAIVLTLLAAGAGLPPKAAVRAASPGRAACCYTNPQHAGVCLVQPVAGETCGSIRAYLNNPKSVGKTYCESTTIRGRWRQVRCASR